MSDSDSQLACAPKHPAEATQPGVEYFLSIDEDYSLFHFIIETVLSGDHIGYQTRQILDGVEPEDLPSAHELAEKSPGPRLRFLRRKRQLFFEMFLARLVDAFQTYLVALIKVVLRSKPQMLASRQPTVSLEDILRHSSVEELLHEVIERRVGALSYEGFLALHSWCADRGIEIPVSDTDRAELVELIATRNVIAHNQGRVDERYLKAVPSSGFAVGERRTITGDYYFTAVERLQLLVGTIDVKAVHKFGLPVVPVAPPSTEAADRDEPGDAQQGVEADEASGGS